MNKTNLKENLLLSLLVAIIGVACGVMVNSLHKEHQKQNIMKSLQSQRNMLPKKTKEYAKTSVRIFNMEETGGGSGVIYKSYETFSEILTNKHVCLLVKKGGYVVTQTEKMLAHAIMPYPHHDLCMVLVRKNLKINTYISKMPPTLFTKSYTSGHPALLPHVLTQGHFSEHQIIRVMVGFRPCTSKERMNNPLPCMFGGKPITKVYESQLSTGTILPGSSGSAVFNEKGKIAGLVFASKSSELSYAYLVPHSFLLDFSRTRGTMKYTTINYKSK